MHFKLEIRARISKKMSDCTGDISVNQQMGLHETTVSVQQRKQSSEKTVPKTGKSLLVTSCTREGVNIQNMQRVVQIEHHKTQLPSNH